jgi:uncharacterized protein
MSSTLTHDDNPAGFQIRSYQPGCIKVNDTLFTHSLILSATTLISDWRPQHIANLTAADFNPILTLKPTILLLGTGATLVFPPVTCYGELINQGIGVEIMNTSAACHTYTALTAENRNVVAALLL